MTYLLNGTYTFDVLEPLLDHLDVAVSAKFDANGALVQGESSAEYTVTWQRLYALAGQVLLSKMSLTVAAGGEVVAPSRMVVQSVALSMSGKMTGVDHVTVGDGGSATFGSTGYTSGRNGTGEVALSSLTVDGVDTNSVASATCTFACTAHGDACKSASWYLAGNTTFLKVTSRCWLSSACVRPDCCHDGFDTHVKAQHVRPSPPPPPPFMRLARRGQRAVHARAGRQVLVRATARRDVTHGAQDYTTTRASLSLHERARE